MTTDVQRRLAAWYLGHYSGRMPKARLERLLSEVRDLLGQYPDGQIERACAKWLTGKSAKWPPFARELGEMAGEIDETERRRVYRKAVDADGFVYDLGDGGSVLYSPYWRDDDPRLQRYYESCVVPRWRQTEPVWHNEDLIGEGV